MWNYEKCVVEKTTFKHLLPVKPQHSVFFCVTEYPVSLMVINLGRPSSLATCRFTGLSEIPPEVLVERWKNDCIENKRSRGLYIELGTPYTLSFGKDSLFLPFTSGKRCTGRKGVAATAQRSSCNRTRRSSCNRTQRSSKRARIVLHRFIQQSFCDRFIQ